jgi:hypothetical protein
MWPETNKVVGAGLPKASRVYNLPPDSQNAGHGSTGFNDLGFQFCFSLIPSFYVPMPAFWNGIFTLYILDIYYWNIYLVICWVYLTFLLYQELTVKFSLSLRENFRF